jgi:hypothetical protein
MSAPTDPPTVAVVPAHPGYQASVTGLTVRRLAERASRVCS